MSIRHVTIRLALAVLGLSAAAAQADDASFMPIADLGQANGEQIYQHICQGCHMPGGEGASGAGFYPKLAGDPRLASWQYAAVTVLNGRNAMPPFGLPEDRISETRSVHLSDAQVAEVVNYIRSHFGNTYADTLTAADIAPLPHPR